MLPNSLPKTGVSHHLGLPVAPRTKGAGAEHTEVGVESPHKARAELRSQPQQQGCSRRLASLPPGRRGARPGQALFSQHIVVGGPSAAPLVLLPASKMPFPGLGDEWLPLRRLVKFKF